MNSDPSPETRRVRIDVVSDIVCPWCAIGLASLERALERLRGEVDAELHFQPFELNPQMGPEGEELVAHLSRKYGISAEQIAHNQQAISQRGEAVGFRFGHRSHTWNTFDAHRLLHWAPQQGEAAQRALKHALLGAYHTRGANVSDSEVLLEAVREAGLDVDAARTVLEDGGFGDEVRKREQFWREMGVEAVPAFVINHRHLISGGQPPEVFERALRQIAGGEH